MTTIILVMIDGMRPDAILQAACPHIENVMSTGAFTLTARSVLPSITLPCHTSIFHSVPPERHGIVTNDWQPMARPLPGLAEVAKKHDKRCAFFYNWENLRDLSRPGHLEYSFFANTAEVRPPLPEGDHIIAQAANHYIKTEHPDFSFVYLGTVDVFGHIHGWMSDEYLQQLERADEALGLLLDNLAKDVTVLVQSDHGGHGRTHGTDAPEDMTIPWMIKGPHIQQGYKIEKELSLLDTAPTIAHLLNMPASPQWEGRCVQEAFIASS